MQGKSIISAWLVFFMAAMGTAHAYFQDAVTGVRPAGMGGAFSAIADDSNTALFNPAGFARIQNLELTGMYSDLYTNFNARLYTGQTDRLGYNFIALGLPFDWSRGGFGLSWAQFYSTLYQENTFAVSYGRQITQPLGLDVGINFKILHWSVQGDYVRNPLVFPFAENSKLGVTADLGALISPLPGLNVAWVMDNIIPADMGLDIHEVVPMIFKAAAAYRIQPKSGYVSLLQFTMEETYRNAYYQDRWLFKLGGEAVFFQKVFSLRMGMNENEFTTGLSLCYAWPSSPLVLQVDYAFSYPFQIAETYGSHRVGATFRWIPSAAPSSAPPQSAVVPREASLEDQRQHAAMEAAKSKQNHQLDEPKVSR